ncbi:hypothetical protein NP493_31g05060 [Ridgeia piscesae]|uniref:DUF5577 domain-containing protein n=1 Tax=Ridgeia piscesae TaxID=27915 RepID=A0AAD9PCW4_RIDPI|nr:hypothetical protein NP493_31g05060 [Ridgeia piscesae]
MASVESGVSDAGSGTMTSLTSFWIKFFKDAGIPVSLAATYAVTFTDNRIKADMLLDLTTELLSYMHIDVMGDVIAILKHAKKVHTEKARENVLKTAENSPKSTRRNISATASSSASTNRTATRRIVERIIGNDTCTKSTSEPSVHVSKEMAARLGPSQSQGDSKKQSSSSVFARLGGTPQRSLETSPSTCSPGSLGASPVVGTKRTLASMLGEEDVVLPYAGVLKSPDTLKRVRLAEAEMSRKKLKDTKIVITNEAAVAEPRNKLVGTGTVTINRLVSAKPQPDIGTLHMDTEGKISIKQRIGGTVVTAATTTTRATKAKTSVAGSHKDLKSRLGQTTDVSSSISVRLGRLRSQTTEVSSSVDTKKNTNLTKTSVGSAKKASVFNRLGTAKDV